MQAITAQSLLCARRPHGHPTHVAQFTYSFQHMLSTGDFTLKDEQGRSIVPEQIKAQVDRVSNNYARPDGQVCI